MLKVSEMEVLDEITSAAQDILAAVQSDLELCGFNSESDRKAHVEECTSEIIKLVGQLQKGEVGD